MNKYNFEDFIERILLIISLIMELLTILAIMYIGAWALL